MTNGYFNDTDAAALEENTNARATTVQSIFYSVRAGFDKLPTEAQLKRGRTTYAATVGGSANAIELTMPHTMASYTAGDTARFLVDTDNTGSVTIDIDGVGPAAVKLPDGSDLAAGSLQGGSVAEVAYTGTHWVMVSGYLSADTVTVSGIASAVSTVAGISGNVSTVAGIAANVTTVAGVSSNVSTVATNISDVNTVATSLGSGSVAGGLMITATGSQTARSLAERFGDGRNMYLDDFQLGSDTYDSTGLQRAIDRAETVGGGRIFLPPETLSAAGSSLVVPDNVHLIGLGKTKTRIFRTADYGDTLQIGESGVGSVSNVILQNIWFYHYNAYENGQAANTFENAVTSDWAHIRAYGPVRCLLDRVAAWNLPYNLVVIGGTDTDFTRCTFRGLWDHDEGDLQVTHANVLLEYAATQGHPSNIDFVGCESYGYLSPSRTVTYGTKTPSIQENIGPKFGYHVKAGEGIRYDSGQVSGSNEFGYFFNGVTGQPSINHTVTGGFCDGNRKAGIGVDNLDDPYPVVNLIISALSMAGQDNTDHAIHVANAGTATTPAVVGLYANIMTTAHCKSAVMLENAYNVEISGIIRNYNSRDGYSSEQDASAIRVQGRSKNVTSAAGLGGGNLGSAPGVNNNCEYGATIADPATQTGCDFSRVVNFGYATEGLNRVVQDGDAASGTTPSWTPVGPDTNIGVDHFVKGTADMRFGRSSAHSFAIKGIASSVTRVEVQPSATGGFPYIRGTGETNTGLGLITSGIGSIFFHGQGSTPQFQIPPTASANRCITVTGSNGGNPTISTTAGLIKFAVSPVLPSYTVGTLPTATAGAEIYVSDGTGNKRYAIGDGSDFRFPDGAVVS